MAKVYAFLADGLEEVECLAACDVLKRAGAEVEMVSVNDGREVVSSHRVRIICDSSMGEKEGFEDGDVLFLPGGMPGTVNLMNCTELKKALKSQYEKGKRIAAICAAPSVLGMMGFLEGRKATCYPGFEDKLKGAVYTKTGVVTDGNITTARGLGYALDLGLELVRLLYSEERAAEVKASIQYDQV